MTHLGSRQIGHSVRAPAGYWVIHALQMGKSASSCQGWKLILDDGGNVKRKYQQQGRRNAVEVLISYNLYRTCWELESQIREQR
jgi:hypothetical protein